MTITILGAGLTGLTAGYLLKKKALNIQILEKETTPGGLMRSQTHEDFTFDYGGSHVIFSKDNHTLTFLLEILGENKLNKKRKSAILYKTRYIKYPFENGLAGLSAEENSECLNSFIKNHADRQAGKKPQPKNLKEWFYHNFGDAISDKYLIPYNTKIWKTQLEDISCEWTNRIPNPPLKDIINSSKGIETDGYTHQLNFYYPKQGGIQALINNFASSLTDNLTTGFEVETIRKQGNNWIISNGKKQISAQKIISTIPINELIQTLDAPAETKKAAANLHYRSLISVMIALDKPKINDLFWLYIPDSNIMPHRISFPSNYSHYTTPENKSSILAEITCHFQDKTWKTNDQDIAQQVIDDLSNLKIIQKQDVIFSLVKRTKYAYVVNDLNYRINIQTIKSYLAEKQIDCIGRFGEFIYFNMDDCVRRAQDYVATNYK